MLPLKQDTRDSRRRAALAAVCLLGVILAAPANRAAAEAAPRDEDARRAEKVLAKLRQLFDAAGANDADAYRGLTSKFYPGLFVAVADMRRGDLSTDLSTAVFLAEELGRKWSAAGGAAPDCGRERPDIYRPLCLGLRGGSARQLLLAKARLHARWAEAVVRSRGGASDAETARALSEMAAARASDALIAARVAGTLKPLEGLTRGDSRAGAGAGFDNTGGESADALRDAGALLAWMPRSPDFYRLCAARQAHADGLAWYGKARESKRLVVSANGFAPDSLKLMGLGPEQAEAAAAANWRSAARLARLAEQSLSQTAR